MLAEKIKLVLVKRKMSMVDLAKLLKTTPSNLYNKCKRDNFSELEMIEIANALDCTFEPLLVLRDTGERF